MSYDYSFSTAAPSSPRRPAAIRDSLRGAPNAVDLSYEKYFENKAILSAAVFYKKLMSYIYDITNPYNFAALNASASPTNTCTINGVTGPCPEQALGC